MKDSQLGIVDEGETHHDHVLSWGRRVRRYAMKALVTLAAAAAAAVAFPAGRVLATTVYTDSWGCSFQGSTYASSGSVNGYTAEDLPYDCSSQVALVFSYKSNGVCYYGSWQYASGWYLGTGASASGAVFDHQIYVPGNGYGQTVGTYYPTDWVC